jgi:alpha 1,6-mannosyltransferase
MMSQHEVANSSLPAQLLHHVTRRRHRVYGAVAVAFVLVSVAVWVYGGFDKGIDFITSIPRPAHIPPVHATPSHFPEAQSAPTVLPPAQPTPANLPPAQSTPAQESAVTETHGGQSVSDPKTQTQTQTHAAPGTQETDVSDAWRHSSQSPAANVSHGIPPYIWQIMLPKKASDDKFIPNAKNLEDTPSWLAMNTDYA